jgi:parvulin-like peptidyl-prolyl isomerase
MKAFNILKDIQKGVRTFDEIAREESDCSETHESGGDMGWVRRGVQPESFEEVAFELKIDEVSKPVETPRGWHLILRKG